MSINSIYLMGRCGKDPEVRTVGQNNSKVAQFSLCTGGKYKTQDGREVDDTAWHNIVAWRNLADIADKYIKKGSQVMIVGHITYREYTDNNGNKRYVTDIVADKIELCGKPEGQQASAPQQEKQRFDPHAVETTPMQVIDDVDDDLPF